MTSESEEREEIEDVKSLATKSLEVSKEHIGNVGKLAYFLHNYMNISKILWDHKIAFVEGRRLLVEKNDEDKYKEVLGYLGEAHKWLGIYYTAWLYASDISFEIKR